MNVVVYARETISRAVGNQMDQNECQWWGGSDDIFNISSIQVLS